MYFSIEGDIDPKRASKTDHFGIYIPLRLRLLQEIDSSVNLNERRSRFSFIFNCTAICSFLKEVRSIITGRIHDETNRLLKERRIIDQLQSAWGLDESTPHFSTLSDLSFHMNKIFNGARSDWGAIDSGKSMLTSGLLEPIIGVIDCVNEELELSSDKVTWIACFDEAEYLKPDLQPVINSIMRSESKGLAVKIATLPFTYTNLETETEGIFIQSDGDDFRFVNIDYDNEDPEFEAIAYNVFRNRVNLIGLFDTNDDFQSCNNPLETFLGKDSSKDLTAIYKRNYRKKEEITIVNEVLKELKERPHSKKGHPDTGQIKRYKPIYFLRELYKKHSKGNTKVAYYQGATMIKKVSGGNMRRFIQICEIIFETARNQFLSENAQQKAIFEFSEKATRRAESVYKEGPFLKEFIETLSKYLKSQMHEGPIKDVGLEFRVSEELISIPRMKTLLEQGIAHSYFWCDETDFLGGISKDTRFRLANFTAVRNWLPMRAGSRVTISSRGAISNDFLVAEVIPQSESEEVLSNNIQMTLF